MEDYSAQNDLLRGLLQSLESHHPGERLHAERVAVYATTTGAYLGLSEDELRTLRAAALLHDVGKIQLDRGLLQKIGQLTEEDLATLRQHAEYAMGLLDAHEFLRPALPAIRSHHERWDGAGYPHGLRGEQIPLLGRIIAVAEAFDVMVFAPFWRSAFTEQKALKELRREAGGQFDPAVVEAFEKAQPLIQPLMV